MAFSTQHMLDLPISRAGSLGYSAESWKEATLHFNVILINFRENKQ